MLYPSIQELLNVTAKDGQERLNKYSITMATAKCARIITNDYAEQRRIAERKIANKETEKDIASLVNKDYRDEKAVKNALREMKEGKFEVYLPGEEGYEDSVVEVKNYEEPKEEFRYIKPAALKPVDDEEIEEYDEEIDDEEAEDESFDDFDTDDLMGASEVFDNDSGFSVEDAEE